MPKMSPASSLTALQQLLQRLRDPEHGCPWSRAQTLTSLVPYTLEEVYEVIAAIEQHDIHALPHELADLLLQIAFYCQIAAEQDWFDLNTVEQLCIQKQLQRKPHLHDNTAISATAAVQQWEAIKAKQRTPQDDSFADIASTLPALLYAKKIQQRAAHSGFDWPDIQPVLEKCDEEQQELHAAIASGDPQHILEELGDVLFTYVNLARHLGVDPEQALLRSNRKFMQRFHQVEQLAKQQQLDLHALSLEQLDRLWQQSKALLAGKGD